MKPLFVIALVVVFALVWQVKKPLAQAVDPGSGTWELSVGKSKFSPGPPPKSQTRTIEITGQSVKFIAKGIDASGKQTLSQYTASYDGKDYPTTGFPDSDSISLKRIDASTVEFTQKRAGKITSAGTRAISKDGKVMTVTFKGTDAKGQPTSGVMVFEKR